MDLSQDRLHIESNGDLKLNIMVPYIKPSMVSSHEIQGSVCIVLCIVKNTFQCEARYSTSNNTLVVVAQTQRMLEYKYH